MVEAQHELRLSATTAGAFLPYDRSNITPGIVHLGIGAFHRAHGAVYVNDILARDPSWGIIGASLRRAETHDALAPQDFLYTMAVRRSAGMETRIIGAVLDVIDAGRRRDALIAALCDTRVRMVSLTVTEKGYCYDPASRQLDLRHPDIVHDLAHPDAPVSAPGVITRALELRRRQGTPPFAVVSCDNLPANGETSAHIVAAFAAARSGELARFIEGEVSFPSTMVDRIVPATTDEDRRAVSAATGLWDAWPVVTEPFTQWVVEDRFPNGRPCLEDVGVELVADVKPFELMKLRMLNGSHSTLAYLGYLAGYELVSQAIADPALRTLILGLMTEEAAPTLPPGTGDLASYRDALLVRFANPVLKHRTWQIAMDGTQKLPQRLLGTIRDRLAKGAPFSRAALGVAGWMRYVTGIDESGKPIEVRDPIAARLRTIADGADRDPQRLSAGLLDVGEVFGDDLPRSEPFRTVLVEHLKSLFDHGAKETARRAVSE